MAMYAPEFPTTAELEAMFPQNADAYANIQASQANVSALVSGSKDGLLVIEGPCAMTLARDIIDQEGDALDAANNPDGGLVTLHRMPPWKPRSSPEAWHGLESDPATTMQAYQTVVERANATANVAIEIGHGSHLERYGEHLSFGWIGSRNAGQLALIDQVATRYPELPIGVKNAMDGTLTSALRHVARIEELRDGEGAPAILMYRGGDNAKDPKSWERQYRDALEATDGRLIVDTSHGGGRAFDPNEEYDRSRIGQVDCLEAVLRIAEDGEFPRGIIMEATSAKSPIDPVMPFHVALGAAQYLHSMRMAAIAR